MNEVSSNIKSIGYMVFAIAALATIIIGSVLIFDKWGGATLGDFIVLWFLLTPYIYMAASIKAVSDEELTRTLTSIFIIIVVLGLGLSAMGLDMKHEVGGGNLMLLIATCLMWITSLVAHIFILIYYNFKK